MKLLLAGNDSIEFGWMVSCWIPAVRKHSRSFDKTVIVCRTGHEYLYEDFADEFVNHDPPGNSDRWLLNGRRPKIPQKILAAYPTATVCEPCEKNCTRWPREYFKYGYGQTDEKYDIVIHARAMTKYHQGDWNYPLEWYTKIIKELGVDSWKCASIGSPTGAHHVPRTNDLRGESLERVCRALANSKVLVGSSSGPMHLGSLCGCPHVVITDRSYQEAIKATNRKRYTSLWNPFGTECVVLDRHNWKTPPHKVAKAIGEYL